MENNKNSSIYSDLFKILANIQDPDSIARFMKDLCTPQEIKALAERWQICKLLHQGNMSYREINEHIGASLATITRVARFLKDEENYGYKSVLDTQVKNIKKKK